MDSIILHNKYSRCDISNLNKQFPINWKKVFEEDDLNKRKEKMLDLWKEICGTELSLVISFLQQNLLDFELVEKEGKYSVIYKLKNDKNEILYYQGMLPDVKNDEGLLQKLPQNISKFYKYLHNGFFDLDYDDIGIMPLENVECLDEYEWGIIEDMKLDLQIDLSTSYSFFSNGSGGYVVIDLNNKCDNNATIWFAKKAPIYAKKFWDFVDEWLLICMNN